MVVVSREINKEGPIRLSSDHAALLPVRWFYEMLIGNNLVITQSLQSLLQSTKMTDRVFADLVLDVQAGLASEWMRFGIYYCDLNTRIWTGIYRGQMGPGWEKDSMRVVYNREGGASLYYGTPYSTTGGLNVKSAADELKYNRVMNAYFAKKYPYKLKSFAPVKGEASVIPVSTSGNRRV